MCKNFLFSAGAKQGFIFRGKTYSHQSSYAVYHVPSSASRDSWKTAWCLMESAAAMPVKKACRG